MIVIASFIIGAFYGWNRAARLNGNRADKVQYAAGFALAFTVIGLILTVVVDRFV